MSRDGTTVPVEVADDLSHVTVDGRRYALRVVSDEGSRVELEVAEQPVVVGAWPARCAVPPTDVEVNGESWSVEVGTGPPTGGGSAAPAPTAEGRRSAAAAPSTASPRPDGSVVLPPMPGRVVEVRVHDGEAVQKGTVLLVLEAMKMRNEIVAPSAGVVRDLRVREGTNVRAREAMMVIAPT